jgi:hypothetical protein
MKGNTLIEHKEVVVACEESGFVGLNYNVYYPPQRLI